jgi:hypothetical protein
MLGYTHLLGYLPTKNEQGFQPFFPLRKFPIGIPIGNQNSYRNSYRNWKFL